MNKTHALHSCQTHCSTTIWHTRFFVQEISKKVGVFLIFWGKLFCPAKHTQNEFIMGDCFLIGKMIWHDSKSTERKHLKRALLWEAPRYQRPKVLVYHFDFYFSFVLSRPQLCKMPQLVSLQELGELFGRVPILTFIDVQMRSRNVYTCMHVDCICLFSLCPHLSICCLYKYSLSLLILFFHG